MNIYVFNARNLCMLKKHPGPYVCNIDKSQITIDTYPASSDFVFICDINSHC